IAHLREGGKSATVQLLAFLDDAIRALHRTSTQPTFDEVDRAPLDPGERRAEKREQIRPFAAEPGKAQERAERLPEGRLREPHLAVHRVRDAEGSERGLERGAHSLDARTDDADALRRRPRTEQGEELLADELERAARARPLEEADGAVDRHRRQHL